MFGDCDDRRFRLARLPPRVDQQKFRNLFFSKSLDIFFALVYLSVCCAAD